MTTKDIYDVAVEMGIDADLRGEEKVKKQLARVKKKFDKLDEEKKKDFDEEKLTNPYADTRVLFDSGKKEVKKVLVGIDMETPELLLADRLGDIDLVIAHHPEGVAFSNLDEVMHLQSEILAGYGVPINIAESVMRPRISAVSRGVAPANHDRPVDTAKLLKINYMCTHTVADNMAAKHLIKKIDKVKPEYVEDVLEMLNKIPEYKLAKKINAGPRLFTGQKENYCGKVVVTEFTGGASGSKDMYEKMAQAGIGTIISMHIGEEHRKQAEKYHLNVVIAGHIASDSLGMNLFLDKLEEKSVEVLTCSGLTRVKR